MALSSFDQVHCLVAVLCWFPEPNEQGSVSVNLVHVSDLVSLFVLVTLIDADGINPKDLGPRRFAKSPEQRLEVWSD